MLALSNDRRPIPQYGWVMFASLSGEPAGHARISGTVFGVEFAEIAVLRVAVLRVEDAIFF